jgi:hypothetical protein
LVAAFSDHGGTDPIGGDCNGLTAAAAVGLSC